jgi:hypothetical protein
VIDDNRFFNRSGASGILGNGSTQETPGGWVLMEDNELSCPRCHERGEKLQFTGLREGSYGEAVMNYTCPSCGSEIEDRPKIFISLKRKRGVSRYISYDEIVQFFNEPFYPSKKMK